MATLCAQSLTGPARTGCTHTQFKHACCSSHQLLLATACCQHYHQQQYTCTALCTYHAWPCTLRRQLASWHSLLSSSHYSEAPSAAEYFSTEAFNILCGTIKHSAIRVTEPQRLYNVANGKICLAMLPMVAEAVPVQTISTSWHSSFLARHTQYSMLNSDRSKPI